MTRRLVGFLGTLVAAAALLLVSALPAWAAQSITLTWVRHAQSTANAAGIIDSTVPGPGLTALGDAQAVAIAEVLAPNAYDGMYVSDMIRTPLTAAPMAAERGMTPVVLGGVREITAGIWEGLGGLAGIGYVLPPAAWVLGARIVPVLGGENGNDFAARVDAAVADIYQSGDLNPVVFSHGATIMAWTLMNVVNPDLLLAVTHPLGNTDVVVMTGNPEDGWTLESWGGIAVSPDPGPLTGLLLDVRAWVVAPQTRLYEIGQGIRTLPARSGPAPVAAPADTDLTAADLRAEKPGGATVPVRAERVSPRASDRRETRAPARSAAAVQRAMAPASAEAAGAGGKAHTGRRAPA
jgi:broad specificity phosphatase PhoE